MQEGPGVAKSGFCVSMSGLSSNHGLKLSCHKAATELPVFPDSYASNCLSWQGPLDGAEVGPAPMVQG